MKLSFWSHNGRVLSGALVFATVALVCAGCGRSEEDIQQEYEELLASSNGCAEDNECVLVSPGCPLGCYDVVNAENKAAVEAKAAELIQDYERGGRSCDYDCTAPGEIACVEGHCQVSPAL